MSTAYKCKSCGAPLRFDPHTGKLRCDHCDASFFPYEYYRSRSDKGTMSAAEVMQAEGAMQVEGEMQAEGVYQADGEKQTEGDIASISARTAERRFLRRTAPFRTGASIVVTRWNL